MIRAKYIPLSAYSIPLVAIQLEAGIKIGTPYLQYLFFWCESIKYACKRASESLFRRHPSAASGLIVWCWAGCISIIWRRTPRSIDAGVFDRVTRPSIVCIWGSLVDSLPCLCGKFVFAENQRVLPEWWCTPSPCSFVRELDVMQVHGSRSWWVGNSVNPKQRVVSLSPHPWNSYPFDIKRLLDHDLHVHLHKPLMLYYPYPANDGEQKYYVYTIFRKKNFFWKLRTLYCSYRYKRKNYILIDIRNKKFGTIPIHQE